MNIGLYDPYFNTLGGGERYILSVGEYLGNKHRVYVYWDDKEILNKAEARFNLDLNNVSIKPNIFKSNLISKLLETKSLDILFFVSDGSFPYTLSKIVYPIIQYPLPIYKNINLNSFKLRNIKKVICYSQYVQNHINKYFDDIEVIAPRVDPVDLHLKKENIILSVGRFTKGKNSKKQEFIIDFWNSNEDIFEGWELVLIGGVLDEDEDYFDYLKSKVKSKNVKLFGNTSHKTLEGFYSRSRIYLHAAGFGEDLSINPQNAEHFGITTVEAMSAGCVPVVFGAGGQKEIVSDKLDGFCWRTEEELKNIFKKLIKNKENFKYLSKNAVVKSRKFNKDNFEKKINKLLT